MSKLNINPGGRRPRVATNLLLAARVCCEECDPLEKDNGNKSADKKVEECLIVPKIGRLE